MRVEELHTFDGVIQLELSQGYRRYTLLALAGWLKISVNTRRSKAANLAETV